jgi:hypothetical protein
VGANTPAFINDDKRSLTLLVCGTEGLGLTDVALAAVAMDTIGFGDGAATA